MRWRFTVSIAAVGVLLMAFGCQKGGSSGEIPVGEYSSLTGTTATFGQSTHNAITMAFDEINAAGGVLGKKVRDYVEDDQSKPEEAAIAATKLINQQHVVALLGEVASSRSLAAGPIAQGAGIPMISPSSTNPRVTKVGTCADKPAQCFVFRVCFIDPFQGKVMAKFAANTLKVKRAAILVDVRNDYSVGLQTFFRDNFKQLGGEIVAEQSYSEGDSDFHAQLTQIKAANPEAIYVPGYYTEVGTISRQAKELGINVPLLGGDGWDSPRLFEIGGPALNGCYISNHYSVDDPSPQIQKFVKDYRDRYKQTPDALAALGYDAAKILVDAMGRAGSTDGVKIRDALAQTKDFPGVTGKITIDGDHNAVKPAVVLKIENGKFVYVETVSP
ncbi:MAG TPA: ABC transporter substrate-binding protein [Thermoanaerobaculia bacterium]|nr:ABC transporter substrate-binding protein [Thermoanaerobaculia bacterium]